MSLGVAGNKGGRLFKLCLGGELRVMKSNTTSSTEFLPDVRTSKQLPRDGSADWGGNAGTSRFCQAGFPELLFPWVSPEIGGWSSGSGTAPGTLQDGSFGLEMGADFPWAHVQCDTLLVLWPWGGLLWEAVRKQGKVGKWAGEYG